MTDLDPCLAGCDAALAEAERMLAMLGAGGTDDTALAPVRHSIAKLRREVGRLRGLKTPRIRKENDPLWIDLVASRSPWPSTRGASLEPPKR